MNRVRLRRATGRALLPIRSAGMAIEAQRVRLDRSPRNHVFNLDVHVSVIADLRRGFINQDATLHSWCLSPHNAIFRRAFGAPDPVRVVTARNWTQLDPVMIQDFQKEYHSFLSKMSGFVSCYPPTFSQLYRGFDKPQLVLSATRYETPFTLRPQEWRAANEYLVDETRAGRMVLAANNAGDRDYMEHHLGIRPLLLPSVCDYTGITWNPAPSRRIFYARSPRISHELVALSRGAWGSAALTLGAGYGWDAAARVEEVFVVPYNISTMSLFEFATAGVPVSVPSRELIVSWLERGESGVLSELSFAQVAGAPPPSASVVDDYRSADFFTWWMDRADFYDSTLMPNVRVVHSLEQLVDEPHPWSIARHTETQEITSLRNQRLIRQRSDVVESFVQMLG